MDTEQNTMRALDVNSLDRDTLLESLTLELMTDNIINQINGNTESSTDFLSIVITKFDTILTEDVIEEDDKSLIKSQMVDFCDNLLCIIAEYYNLAINMVDESYESYIKLTNTLYNFLVLNKFANVENCLLNYIRQNRQEIIDTLDLAERGKDIVSMSSKKRNVNKDNICILAGLNGVIDFLATTGIIDADVFMDTIDDGEYYLSQLREYYADGTIIGDFTHALFGMALGDAYDNNEYTRIRNTLRIELTKEPSI